MSADVVAQLNKWLDELARKWERFLARDPGAPVPPERERALLERRLLEISREEAPTAEERFRLERLMNRFASHNALWLRLLREREEAREASFTAKAANVRSAASVSTGDAEYRRIFVRYQAELEKTGGMRPMSFERFRETLAQQKKQLEEQGAVVEGFEVVKESSGVKVRAKVRRGGLK
jgi:hypothetical protein